MFLTFLGGEKFTSFCFGFLPFFPSREWEEGGPCQTGRVPLAPPQRDPYFDDMCVRSVTPSLRGHHRKGSGARVKIVSLSPLSPFIQPDAALYAISETDTVKVLNIERPFFAGGCLNVGSFPLSFFFRLVLFHYPFFLHAHLPPSLAVAVRGLKGQIIARRQS